MFEELGCGGGSDLFFAISNNSIASAVCLCRPSRVLSCATLAPSAAHKIPKSWFLQLGQVAITSFIIKDSVVSSISEK